jgi:ABC-type iron transport system FetAB ATPase subunit
MDNMTLTDNAISHIAQLVQVAILTGTDIVDNLRLAQFVSNKDHQIDISPDYYENFNSNIQRLVSEADDLSSSTEQEEA